MHVECVCSQGNSDALVGIGLNLVTVVIECSSQHLCLFPSLAALVQDTLSQHLIQVRGEEVWHWCGVRGVVMRRCKE